MCEHRERLDPKEVLLASLSIRKLDNDPEPGGVQVQVSSPPFCKARGRRPASETGASALRLPTFW
jgi:hypothetical protein